jgi:hypothetical protein
MRMPTRSILSFALVFVDVLASPGASAKTTSSKVIGTDGGLRLSSAKIANKYALYNLLSTFSATPYVTPRASMAKVGSHF